MFAKIIFALSIYIMCKYFAFISILSVVLKRLTSYRDQEKGY